MRTQSTTLMHARKLVLLLAAVIVGCAHREPMWPAAASDPIAIERQSVAARQLAPQPEPDTESPYLAAHTAIAKALGYVAIQCWVGTEWDTDDLVGSFQQRIANGWYTNVEPNMAGRHGVEQRYINADVPSSASSIERLRFETYLDVSWEAERGANFAECKVERVEQATLHVRVVDTRGRPLREAIVYGCGGDSQADADGLATLAVDAATRCGLSAYFYGTGRQFTDACYGAVQVPPLADGEVRDASITLHCGDILSIPMNTAPPPSLRVGTPRRPTVRFPEYSDEEELSRFRILSAHDFGEHGNRLIDELVLRRARAIDDRAKRSQARALEAQLFDRIETLMREAENAPPREARALRAEAAALLETIESSDIQ